ncbi:hypothetical protein [Halorientalis halophila]|uniref:hypothetical protein n=1 Tax=Halorientalis halophila TaxID=3108499 RepID=UPI003008AE8B
MHERERLPELPAVEPGLQLLQSATDAPPVEAIQSLALDALLLGSSTGTAVWIDALDHARTDTLSTLAPDPRVLDRIRVARGFTAYQHAAIVERCFEAVRDGPDADARRVPAPEDVSLIVCPAVDALYRADDVRSGTAEDLLYRVLARLRTLARELDVPVLVSRWKRDDLSAPFETAADGTITCRETAQGLRFETADRETLAYPLGDGLVQTTLTYWAEILRARQPLYERYSVGDPDPITPATLEG